MAMARLNDRSSEHVARTNEPKAKPEILNTLVSFSLQAA
jgi:hypothetical protein